MIYVIGSLKNPKIQHVAKEIRSAGYEVFDDWHAVGPDADDYWQRYELARNRTYQEALLSPHAIDVFEFDLRHLEAASSALLVLPAGKSAHLELGWMIGQGKPGFILLNGQPDRFDIMYRFASGVYDSVPAFLAGVKGVDL